MISKSIACFADKPYRFSINFSMSDLEDDEIINTLIGHFTAYPEIVMRMDIELLESEMLTDMNKVKNFIAELNCQVKYCMPFNFFTTDKVNDL